MVSVIMGFGTPNWPCVSDTLCARHLNAPLRRCVVLPGTQAPSPLNHQRTDRTYAHREPQIIVRHTQGGEITGTASWKRLRLKMFSNELPRDLY
jgi:hypothetical protein